MHGGLEDRKANCEALGQRGEQERRPGGAGRLLQAHGPGRTRLAEAGREARPDALLAAAPAHPGGELPALA